MPAKKYHVTLTDEQRTALEKITRAYKSHTQRERNRARVLLLTDTAREDGGHAAAHVAIAVGVCTLTVESVRRRFVQQGLQAAVYRREQTTRKARVLDGRAEAFLIATVCSAPPRDRPAGA